MTYEYDGRVNYGRLSLVDERKAPGPIFPIYIPDKNATISTIYYYRMNVSQVTERISTRSVQDLTPLKKKIKTKTACCCGCSRDATNSDLICSVTHNKVMSSCINAAMITCNRCDPITISPQTDIKNTSKSSRIKYKK